MTFYVIRNKETKEALPEYRGRGYTWTEPTNERPPRLFPTVREAKICLSWWAKGKLRAIVDPYDGYLGNKRHGAVRNSDDFEIVEVQLWEKRDEG